MQSPICQRGDVGVMQIMAAALDGKQVLAESSWMIIDRCRLPSIGWRRAGVKFLRRSRVGESRIDVICSSF